jgi:hypothetical protein
MALTIGYLASATDGGGSGTTLASSSFTSTGYQYLVTVLKHEGAAATITAPDNKGSTLTGLTKNDLGGAEPFIQIFWGAIGTPGTSHVVTLTVSAARTWKAIGVWGVSVGAGNTLALDVEAAGGENAFNATPDAGSLVTTAAAVLFMSSAHNAGLTFTQGTGWTLRAHGDAGMFLQDRNEASSGTFDPAGSANSSAGWAAVAAAFKEVAGAGGGGNPWYAYAQQRVRTVIERRWQRRGLLWTPSYATA